MNQEIFAEWLLRQGHKVIQTPSSYWVNFGPRVLQAFPYHHIIEPSDEELSALITEHKVLGLRYSAPQRSNKGSPSYHVVLEKENYTQKDLPKKARYDVKKGLSTALVEPISLSRLATEGWTLRKDTLIRQGRLDAETEADWRKLCLSTEGLEGFTAWGAISQGRLIAAVLTFLCDDYLSILYHQSLTEFLRTGVNNALAFVVTSSMINRPVNKVKTFYGLHSLDAPSSVDEFKFRMGYTAKPVRQRVVFHPWVRPLMNKAGHAFLGTGLRLRPGHPTLSKAEGMLRFYLQGKLPLSKQSLPPPLQKDSIAQTLQE